jgi:hypothetical protein
MPKTQPVPGIKFDMDGSAKLAKRMDPETTLFLCTIEWWWSPVNERKESYYLQRSNEYWNLWIKQYDDNYDRWETPFAIAMPVDRAM